MRTRIFRGLALVIGFLGIPSLAWDAWNHWPLETLRAWLLVSELIVCWAFIMFGIKGDQNLTIAIGPDGKPIVVSREEAQQDSDRTQ
jgi:hypothetical protein